MSFNVMTNRFEDQWGNSPFDPPRVSEEVDIPHPDGFIEPNTEFIEPDLFDVDN